MKAVVVIGVILIALGLGDLGYFTSPVRSLMMSYDPHRMDLKLPIAGGLSLALGIAMLFVSGKLKSKQ